MTFPSLKWDDRFITSLPGDPSEVNRPRQVHNALFTRVTPSAVSNPVLIAYSKDVASSLGLSDDEVHSEAFAQVFGGNQVVDGMTPWANNYGGHQFGNWAGQLGDGRAITLGLVRSADGSQHELQLKGAGPTPYSRSGDGRAVLRSSIREFLCSEAMHHLGIPTTRALSLISTGDPILRDMLYDGHPAYEPGAIVCRVAESFLRLGSFQLPSSRGEIDTLRSLTDYTLRTHFPQLGPLSKDSVLAMLTEICRRTAVLMAHWMRVGFVHGVMNTDNLSILGLTLDYGPYGWLDAFDPSWTPNLTDSRNRRYRYAQQPIVAHWNLVRFAEALYPLVEDVPALEAALDTYESTWVATYTDTVRAKLGLVSYVAETDDGLWEALQTQLSAVETDMTLFFRGLAEVPTESDASEDELLAPIEPAFYLPISPPRRERWISWLRQYRDRVRQDGRPDALRKEAMNKVNPLYVLRNYLAQEAIEQAEEGDYTRVQELLEVMRTPYTEQPGKEHFAQKRPEWARHKAGCSALSCSS